MRKLEKKALDIEEQHNRKLTNRQKEFARHGVTLLGQLKRFSDLSSSAEEAGQFSASINAERIRSALGGLTIDRRETNHYHAIENMSRDEIETRLNDLRKDHPQMFVDAEYKEVNDTATREPIVEQIEGKSSKTLEHD
jgi:ribosomal protein L9